jgi:hypothetical protein
MQKLKINNTILVAAIVLLPLFSVCQNSFVKEISNFNTGIPADPSASKILSFLFKNTIYFLDPNKYDKKDLVINAYDIIANKKRESIFIENNKLNRSLLNVRIFSFAITDTKVIALTDSYIFILKIEKNKATVVNSIKNEKAAYSKIRPLNENEFLLYVYYNFHPLDAPVRHVWAKLNIEKQTIENRTIQDDKNAIYTHLVNDWLSTYKGLIAHSNTIDYQIYFYNDKFEKIDSINSDKLETNKAHLNSIPDNISSKDEIMEVIQKDDSLLKRIQKIFLVDSTTLLVMLKVPKSRNAEFDLWQKKSGAWVLKKTESINTFYQDKQAYNSSNNKINPFYGSMYGTPTGSSNMFYIIYTPFMEDITTDSFNLNKDYNQKINDMVRDNKVFYGIKKIKIIP